MKLRTPYEHIPLLPFLMAETICGQPYTGMEWSDHSRPDVAGTEAKRQTMTPAQIEEFANLCDNRCRMAYERRVDWMLKCARSKTNAGREQLYVWLSHWLSAYLKDPELFRHKARRFA